MKKLLPWFAALLLIMIVIGTVYGTVQQSQRNDANYPQIQIAEDAADILNHGGEPQVISGSEVNFAKSLQPFVIIYDKKGTPINGSGYLNGNLAKAPLGVLEAAKGEEYNAVTWQPQKDVRVASVTVAAKDYYVLSGRNLKEVEKNEAKTLQLALLGGIAAMAMFALVFILSGLSLEEY